MNDAVYIPIAEGRRLMHALWEALKNSPDINTTTLQDDLPQCPMCGVRVPVKYGRRSGQFTAWHPSTECPISWQTKIWMPSERAAIENFTEAWT